MQLEGCNRPCCLQDAIRTSQACVWALLPPLFCIWFGNAPWLHSVTWLHTCAVMNVTRPSRRKPGLVAQRSWRSGYSQITNVWIVSFHSRHEQDVLIQCLGMLSCPCPQLEYFIKSLQIISSQNPLKPENIRELQSSISSPGQRAVCELSSCFYQREQASALQSTSK